MTKLRRLKIHVSLLKHGEGISYDEMMFVFRSKHSDYGARRKLAFLQTGQWAVDYESKLTAREVFRI